MSALQAEKYDNYVSVKLYVAHSLDASTIGLLSLIAKAHNDMMDKVLHMSNWEKMEMMRNTVLLGLGKRTLAELSETDKIHFLTFVRKRLMEFGGKTPSQEITHGNLKTISNNLNPTVNFCLNPPEVWQRVGRIATGQYLQKGKKGDTKHGSEAETVEDEDDDNDGGDEEEEQEQEQEEDTRPKSREEKKKKDDDDDGTSGEATETQDETGNEQPTKKGRKRKSTTTTTETTAKGTRGKNVGRPAKNQEQEQRNVPLSHFLCLTDLSTEEKVEILDKVINQKLPSTKIKTLSDQVKRNRIVTSVLDILLPGNTAKMIGLPARRDLCEIVGNNLKHAKSFLTDCKKNRAELEKNAGNRQTKEIDAILVGTPFGKALNIVLLVENPNLKPLAKEFASKLREAGKAVAAAEAKKKKADEDKKAKAAAAAEAKKKKTAAAAAAAEAKKKKTAAAAAAEAKKKTKKKAAETGNSAMDIDEQQESASESASESVEDEENELANFDDPNVEGEAVVTEPPRKKSRGCIAKYQRKSNSCEYLFVEMDLKEWTYDLEQGGFGLIAADIPYGILKDAWDKEFTRRELLQVFSRALDFARPACAVLCFCSLAQIGTVIEVFEELKLNPIDPCVYLKKWKRGFIKRRHLQVSEGLVIAWRGNYFFEEPPFGTPRINLYESNSQGKSLVEGDKRWSETCGTKDVQVLQELVRKLCQPNDIVLDLFSGSASLAAACWKEDRSCTSIDIRSGIASSFLLAALLSMSRNLRGLTVGFAQYGGRLVDALVRAKKRIPKIRKKTNKRLDDEDIVSDSKDVEYIAISDHSESEEHSDSVEGNNDEPENTKEKGKKTKEAAEEDVEEDEPKEEKGKNPKKATKVKSPMKTTEAKKPKKTTKVKESKKATTGTEAKESAEDDAENEAKEEKKQAAEEDGDKATETQKTTPTNKTAKTAKKVQSPRKQKLSKADQLVVDAIDSFNP